MSVPVISKCIVAFLKKTSIVIVLQISVPCDLERAYFLAKQDSGTISTRAMDGTTVQSEMKAKDTEQKWYCLLSIPNFRSLLFLDFRFEAA